MNWVLNERNGEEYCGPWTKQWNPNLDEFVLAHDDPDKHLTQYYGYGKTEREAFQDVLKRIEEYEARIKELKEEILAELKGDK